MAKKKLPENADFDHGFDDPTHLRTYKIRPHDFKSKPQGKVRPTGNYADNAMYDDSKINESEDSALERLHGLLANASVSDDEIINGITLTEKGKQKVAAALGIAGSEVELMINSLSTKMRKERELTETAERFSAEDDYLGNVTIRDKKTGSERFVRGSNGTELLTKLKKADSEEDQRILKKAVSEDKDWIAHVRDRHANERDTYNRDNPPKSTFRKMIDRITGKDRLKKVPEKTLGGMGTFNFSWTYNGKSGTGTAQFYSMGQRTRVEVQSTRDRMGREYNPDPETANAIQRQAYETISGMTY